MDRSALNNPATDALELVVASLLRPLLAKTCQPPSKNFKPKITAFLPFDPWIFLALKFELFIVYLP
ncbi:MAG: hypothetical protein AAB739_03335 [Patescibacteria group bacterium]